jgi:hypothetical protein
VLNVIPVNATNPATLLVSNETPTNAPITDINGNLLSGPGYLAQVYAAYNDSNLLPASPAVPFLTGTNAGYFAPIDLLLPGVPPGSTVHVQVRVWDSAGGTSYEDAVISGAQHGSSQVIDTTTGGGSLPTPQLSGLASFSLVAPPHFIKQPANQTVYLGQSANFEGKVSGSTPLFYQWVFDGNALAGATSTSLMLTNVQLSQAGEYRLIATNALGSVTSSAVTLTVRLPDTNAPIVVIASPAPGIIYDPTVTLSGTVTDDGTITSASWTQNGGAASALTLQDGHFSVPDISVSRGTNILQVTAVDSFQNQTTISVSVVGLASRTLYIGDIPPTQEGGLVTVPLFLASRGDVGGVSFNLSYDRSYFSPTDVTWLGGAETGFTQVNTNSVGIVRASFALSGVALPAGTQQIASVTFRAANVPQTRSFILSLSGSGIFSASGDPLVAGTDIKNGNAVITQRKYIGDNNGNDRLDVGDASIIMRMANLLQPVSPWDITDNDLNQNHQLDTGDVIRVLRAVVGLDPQPGATNGAMQELSAASVHALDAGSSFVTLESDNQTVSAGGTVTVRVVLKDPGTSVSGASFKLSYPAAALRLDSAASHHAGAIVPANAMTLWNLSPGQNDYSTQDGTISLAVSTDTAWATNSGVLAEFTFTVQPGATNLYRLPIEIRSVEVSNGYLVDDVASSQLAIFGRSATPANLSASFDAAKGGLQISLSGEVGESYRIEVSDDLKTWSELTVLANTNGQLTVSDPDAVKSQSRFYRATLVDQNLVGH